MKNDTKIGAIVGAVPGGTVALYTMRKNVVPSVVALMMVLSATAFASGMADPGNLKCRANVQIDPIGLSDLQSNLDEAFETTDEVVLCITYNAPSGLLDDLVRTTVEIPLMEPTAASEAQQDAVDQGLLLIEGAFTLFIERRAPVGKWALRSVQTAFLPQPSLSVEEIVSYVTTAVLSANIVSVEYRVVPK